MPLNKSQSLRCKIINACLTDRHRPYPTLEEIRDALAKHDLYVGKRTIEADLEAMRHDKRLAYHAPIAFCRRNHGYHYTDPDYSIEKLPLTADDMEAFQLIVESFKRFKGAHVLRHVEGMFDKLDKVVMQQRKTKKTERLQPVADFEKVPYSKGIEHFDKLYEAITQHKALHITYQRFDRNKPSEHLFHPYLLKEYKFRWYVLGYSEQRRGKLTLALDRIEHIRTSRSTIFKAYKGNDLQKYFDHTIGVTINATGVKEIRVWFSPTQGNYIKTQHLHATQRIIADDATGLIVTFQLIPNYELLQTLLAFGPECKVLEPASLQSQLKDMLQRTLERYTE